MAPWGCFRTLTRPGTSRGLGGVSQVCRARSARCRGPFAYGESTGGRLPTATGGQAVVLSGENPASLSVYDRLRPSTTV